MVLEINSNQVNTQYKKDVKQSMVEGYGRIYDAFFGKISLGAVESNDDQEVQYKITNDADLINEAKEYDKTMSKFDVKLKDSLLSLVSVCEKRVSQMADLQKELNSYGGEIKKTVDKDGKTVTEIENVVKESKTKKQEQEQLIRDKKIQMVNNDKDVRSGKMNADVANKQNEQLQSEIDTITSDFNSYVAGVKSDVASARTSLGVSGKSLESVTDKTQKALSQAVDANEFAELTKNKGLGLKDMVDNLSKLDGEGRVKQLTENGFAPKDASIEVLTLGAIQSNVVANASVAIATVLENSSSKVANQVQNVTGKYDIAVDKENLLNRLVEKSNN